MLIRNKIESVQKMKELKLNRFPDRLFNVKEFGGGC